MPNLITMSKTELDTMGTKEFLMSLDGMSMTAIQTLRRKRKLPENLDKTIAVFLQEKDKAAAAKPKSAVKRKVVKPKTPAKFAADDGYIPFPERFRAWWNGSTPDTGPKQARPTDGTGQTDRTKITQSSCEPEENDWPARIRERVWGTKFVLPGTSNVILDMAKISEMQPGHAAADILPGCTGPAEALHKAYSAPVMIFEADREVCSAIEGQPQSGLRVSLLETTNPDLGTKAFDRIFCREVLCFLPMRDILIRQAGLALKGGGRFVFNDMVLCDTGGTKSMMESWREAEPKKPVPWSLQDYKEQLMSSRFELCNTADITQSYVADVEACWRQLMTSLETDPLPPAGVDALMAEGKIWQSRIAALKSGKVIVMRIHASLKGVRSLSGPS